MQVLSWSQKRKMILRSLAVIDAAVARRVGGILEAWAAAREDSDAALAEKDLATNPNHYEYPTGINERSPRRDEGPNPEFEQQAEGEYSVPSEPEEIPAPPPQEQSQSKSLASYLD